MRNEILIVDDDETSIFLLKNKLKKIGCSLPMHESNNGKRALEFLVDYEDSLRASSEESICLLIFLDINMPLLNGFEFVDAFVEKKGLITRIQPVVVYMFSSSENPKDLKKVEDNNAIAGFVLKFPENEYLQQLLDRAFAS